LSGRGLCDEVITRPEESYRLCCVVVCDLETSRMGAPYIYDISRLRVNCYYFAILRTLLKTKTVVEETRSRWFRLAAIKETEFLHLVVSFQEILFSMLPKNDC